MTTIYNDPQEFAENQLAGFTALYADRLRQVPGGVVAHAAPGDPKVAVVVGGGSGHYPAFAGLVGSGFAAGAVVGNIFTSPSAAQVYSVAKAASQGRGVILTFGNYAGDTMNFGIAAKRLSAEGIETRIVVVTDDIASSEDRSQRRGIAGDFPVFKMMGAAAEEGLDIDEVARLGERANDRTSTLGVAFSGCTMPGAESPLFTVPANSCGIGLGIHGEPGIRDEPILRSPDLARLFVESVFRDRPEGAGHRAAVILNGLGTTKYEELFLLWGEIHPLLADAGVTIVDPEVGELVTSLDMGGVSLTVTWLDDDLERLWRADAYTPAFRKVGSELEGLAATEGSAMAGCAAESWSEPTPETLSAAAFVQQVGESLRVLLKENESELGRLDAVAGDGDHGRGMLRGISAGVGTFADQPEAGPGAVLIRAGRAWAEQAGGTSGVLWGAGLEAAGAALERDSPDFGALVLMEAAKAFREAVQELGGASVGDKTLVDVLVPFLARLEEHVQDGREFAQAWIAAAGDTEKDADATQALTPRKGRARPLGEKSVGTPDPGAISLGMMIRRVAEHLGA